VGDVEQPFQLLQSNGDGSTRHETYYGCMGEKLGDKPQPGIEKITTEIASFRSNL